MERVENTKIRYAIFGAGEHALRAHALPGTKIPDLELTGVFDPSGESVQTFINDFGMPVHRFSSETELFDSPADAVLIASPDRFHTKTLEEAVEAGKHVLVEKPLALDPEQIAQLPGILAKADSRELVLTSCHPRRFDPPFLWLKENLPQLKQKYGDVLNFDFDFSYHKPATDESSKWKQIRSLLLDHANHELDLMHFLFGISEFEAWKLFDSFERYELAGRRDDNINFNFKGTRMLDSKIYSEFVDIRFQRGDLHLDTETGKTSISSHEIDPETKTHLVTVLDSGKTDYDQRFAALTQNFVDAIRGTAPNYLTPQDLWVNNWFGVELASSGHASYQPEIG